MKKMLLVLTFTMLGLHCANAKKPLTFIAHPDWHAGDIELGLVQPSNGTFEIQDTILTDMLQFDAKYILLSGDMLDALWLTNTGEGRSGEILERKAYLMEKFAPGASDDELVATLAKICYDGLNARFRRFGLEPIGAIGDHEVGDQNWTKGSPRANAVPAFRQAFMDAYTIAEGRSKFDGMIGGVPQRPVGTQYENTCNAFVDQNVLFVTVDLYRFEGVDTVLHPVSGVLSVEMAPEIETWLDALLTEAAGMDDIRFTVVQAHHPLILPIRKIQTSCIMINDREESRFWKLLRKHRVDVYFSGEVHALTVQVDAESQVAHIICGSFLGNTAHNYMVCDAYEDRLVLRIREKVGEGNRYLYETTGEMVIDKSADEKKITASGRLEPLDLSAPLFHYHFDQDDLSEGVMNAGQFGSRLYKGIPVNARLGEGKIGKALIFGEAGPGHFYTRGKCPTDYDIARTATAWIQTGQKTRGTIWALGADDFCLMLDNGVLKLQAENQIAYAKHAQLLNDQTWHHVAVVYPGGPATLKDVVFYIDGKRVQTILEGDDTEINTAVFSDLMVGGIRRGNVNPYQGALDDLRLWTFTLTDENIKTVYEEGL